MTEMPSKTDGFESLVLPPGHKEIVKALVQMHSQASGDSQIDPGRQLDLVRGKGEFCNIGVHTALPTVLLDGVEPYAGRQPKEPGEESRRGPSVLRRWL